MSTAIMHSTSLYDFGEYPRKNQTNSSRSNTQLVGSGGGGGGGGGGSNAASINATSGASSSNNQLLLSQSFNVAAAMAAANSSFTGINNNMLNGQQTLNSHHHQQQQQLQQQQQQHQQQNFTYQLQKQPSAHKQQHALGTHNALHRSVSQPATKVTYTNIMELLKLTGVQSVLSGNVDAAMAITTAVANGNCSSSSASSSSSSASSINSNNGNNHTSNTSSSSGHRKLERTQSEPLPQQVNTSRYKTELCRPYEEAGECKYGDKCQFAHGVQELRNLQRHPKYKTELCRTFHSVGFCPYGPRCHFVHNAEEARNHNRNVAAYHARLAAAAAVANASQPSQGATGKNNNGSSVINSAGQHHHQHHSQHQQGGAQSQQHVSGLNAVGVAQLRTAAALLQQHHQQQQQQQQNQQHHHQLPLSPALSMSTGSDRASPIGSLSLSPTTSMASFFPEASSPTFQQAAVQHAFSFPNSPPASPIDGLSPMATPPPASPSLTAMLTGLEERLPVFNRLSSAMDAFTNLAL